jgi:hypothetical protein
MRDSNTTSRYTTEATEAVSTMKKERKSTSKSQGKSVASHEVFWALELSKQININSSIISCSTRKETSFSAQTIDASCFTEWYE